MLDQLKILLLLASSIILLSNKAHAQGVSTDELWAKARYYTHEEKDYNKAEKYIKTALNLEPQNQDFSLLLARIYWLSKQFDAAEKSFLKLLDNDDDNYELYIQLLNFYESQELYSSAYRWIEKALEKFTHDENLLFRKAYNLELQGYDWLAYKASKELLTLYPDNTKAKYIHDSLYPRYVENFVLGAYSSYYSNNTEAITVNFYNIQYGRRLKNSTLILMTTMVKHGNRSGMQYSAEMYRKIRRHMSSYLHISLSPSELLPYLRLTGQINRGFDKGFEGSLRLNALFLKDNIVQIWCPGIGKYYNNLYFQFGTNFIVQESKTELTYNFKIRRYLGNPQNYLDCTIGSIPSSDIIGYRPDENMIATFIAVEGKMKVGLRSSIGVSYLKNVSKSAQSRDLLSLFVKQDL